MRYIQNITYNQNHQQDLLTYQSFLNSLPFRFIRVFVVLYFCCRCSVQQRASNVPATCKLQCGKICKCLCDNLIIVVWICDIFCLRCACMERSMKRSSKEPRRHSNGSYSKMLNSKWPSRNMFCQ